MPRDRAGRTAERKQLADERPADFDRLPKRYKDYIFALEEKLHSFQSMADAESDSLVWLEAYGREVRTRHLPSDARVCFKLPAGEVEVRIDKRRGGDAVEITSGFGGLNILPGVSNQIWIKIER